MSDGGNEGAPSLPSSSQQQSASNDPHQSQSARLQSQQPIAGFQQSVLLDLQREYSVVREHVSRKDTASGIPAIASIAALRSCMSDLKDAAKIDSEAWFLIRREKIDEELIRRGFAGLPPM